MHYAMGTLCYRRCYRRIFSGMGKCPQWFVKSNLKTDCKQSTAHTKCTWSVRMVALLPHEDEGSFLEFRKNKQILCFYGMPAALHSGFAYLHSEQPTFYQQENEISSFPLPTASRNRKINLLHMLPPIAEFSLPK